ncbi:hypothetical protein [Mycobacterium sp.]|uniref:hypothetical protein n=1 Tax=Mycobacterium sp. TaxID=1785 RepID=UPI00120E3BAD|nr:hypothetical protein [Mycobacterium sp.]TAM68297.1 MAG: hypothetical protein EPN51_11995 [Mycobacterium sp.]
MTEHTPLDALAHAHAKAKFIAAWVQPHDPDGQHQLTRYLNKLERDLGEHVERFGIANATHYTTGLPIWSLEKPAAGADFAWVWHPDPAHPSNAPRILDADADLGNGERGTIVISSPGRIDVVRHKV